MELTCIGVDGSHPSPGGACSGYLLKNGEKYVLIDCGSGVFGKLALLMNPTSVDAIVLSHLHGDHFSDMMVMHHALLHAVRAGVRADPMPVYAPILPEELNFYAGIGEFAWSDIATLIQPLSLCGMSARFFAGRHAIPSYAMRFEADGKVFCYTGDTNTVDGLADFARGCDVLLIDAALLHEDWAERAPHLSARLAAELGRDVGAKRVLLTHVFPKGADAQALLSEAVCHARITRFEVMEPTLEEIFIEKVTADSAEAVAGDRIHA